MNRRNKKYEIIFLLIVCLIGISCKERGFLDEQKKPKKPVDFVDPLIGSMGHLLKATLPVVQLPFGMAAISPQFRPGVRDHYVSDKIFGFPIGYSSIMPGTQTHTTTREQWASGFDHDFEKAMPYLYQVLLEDDDIQSNHTVTEHAAFFEFFYAKEKPKTMAWFLGTNAHLAIGKDQTLLVSSEENQVRQYVAGFFEPAPERVFVFQNGIHIEHKGKTIKGNTLVVLLKFGVSREQNHGVRAKFGLSFISEKQAQKNVLQEIPHWDFSATKERAKDIWNQVLSRIRIDGGTEKHQRIFYTALYRSLLRMKNVSEYGRYFSAYDHQIHHTDGVDFYTDDWSWDTYRTLHPLQIMLFPKQSTEMITSYVRMYEQSGFMPSFPQMYGDRPCMLGHHATTWITDAYFKGLKDFDQEKAFEGMKKNATQATMLPWKNGRACALDEHYFKHGYFPALDVGAKETVPEVSPKEKRQAVAVTLEHAYNDWCLSQFAKALGKKKDAAYFFERSQNYKNVFRKDLGLMAPKNAKGEWVDPFDPTLGGGQGGRDYFAESNSWVYTWSVPHDLPGLFELMGGRQKAEQKLDQLFVEQYGGRKYRFLGQFPDCTGLIGQYAQGNEPSFHIAYLYNHLDAPWKTQRRVRQIMDVWYDDDPLGIPGDEDGGAMSSWFVFSALGFYPVTPGIPEYDIGSPLFEKTTIQVGENEFVIEAKHFDPKHKYIQKALLNGKPLLRPKFSHETLKKGGHLVLFMGPRPNMEWGTYAN